MHKRSSGIPNGKMNSICAGSGLNLSVLCGLSLVQRAILNRKHLQAPETKAIFFDRSFAVCVICERLGA